MSHKVDPRYLIGVTIHIARNKADQENNFDYIERVLRDRGVGQFQHVLGAEPIDIDECDRRITDILHAVHPQGLFASGAFEPFHQEGGHE